MSSLKEFGRSCGSSALSARNSAHEAALSQWTKSDSGERPLAHRPGPHNVGWEEATYHAREQALAFEQVMGDRRRAKTGSRERLRPT